MHAYFNDVQLVKSKCFPVLFYGLEACLLQYKSINYVINSTFRNCLQAEETIAIRKRKFLNIFRNVNNVNNVLCQVFVVSANKELESCCADV